MIEIVEIKKTLYDAVYKQNINSKQNIKSALLMKCKKYLLPKSSCIPKELLARSRRQIWRLSDRNRISTHNYLVCKQTLNHLAKPFS